MTVFAFATIAALSLIVQAQEVQRRTSAVEARLADENRLLTAYALLARTDLDRRIGETPVGPYTVRVSDPGQDTYLIVVDDTAGLELATIVFRPWSSDAP